MQRLFSIFPSGWPGVALLLLRGSVALAVLLPAYSQRQVLPSLALLALILLSAILCAGFLTPVVAGLAAAVHLVAALSLGTGNEGATLVAIVDALALALLGPGAYSIDARRFGRRLVELPRRRE
jgi:uncharacterized membrane protein YphA (DoxX/SURF4 family)